MGSRRVRPWVYLAALSLALVSLFPFAWMLISSFKELRELYTVPPTWWPDRPTLANYVKVLTASNIPRYFLNSMIISFGATALALAVAIFSAYGFARFRFRGRGPLQTSVLASQMLPTAVIIVPLFVVLRNLGLLNTHLGLILVYLILTLPLCVYMLTGYFRTIPVELDEAAIIDGASRLTVLFRITLPLSL
ncbi:MAG: carbohydrate ABC transporter permease, partial [Pseudomonadales bacterium]